MAWDKKKLDMIRKKQVVYMITKNGEDYIPYLEFFPCMVALSNLQNCDKMSKYDVVVRPKSLVVGSDPGDYQDPVLDPDAAASIDAEQSSLFSPKWGL